MLMPKLLFAPPETSGIGSTTELNSDDILKELNKDEGEELDIKKNKEEEVDEVEEIESEETEESDELDEIEEELDDEDNEEEKDEDLEIHQPITRKEVLKAYPDIFKKFPELERTIGRENALTKFFPTVRDAEEASEKSKIVDLVESDVANGDLTRVIGAFKNNPQVFGKIVDNYLPNLFKIDKDAYFTVIGNTIKDTVKSMVVTAKKDNNSELADAAENLYKFVFGHSNWEEPVRLSKNDSSNNKELDELNQEKRKFTQERFETSRNEIIDKVESRVKRTIEKFIDPKDSMTSYIKKNAIKDAFDLVSEAVNSDSRLKGLLDKLWKNASSNNFSKSSLQMIDDALTKTAKKYLTDSIKKARSEAIGSTRKSKEAETEEEDRPLNKGKAKPIKNESSSFRHSGKTDSAKAKEIPASMSTLDYLNS